MPTIALLDGHSLAYRAFYALPSDLATPTGQVTNAVFGFTSMLIKLIDEERPDVIAVAWDVRGKTFRSGMYSEYKAQRDSPPDLFTGQLPLIREVLEALHIQQLGVGGVEADDVIATLATQAKAQGWRALVVTGDRDAFQLIADGIDVLYTRRGISDTVQADARWIEERYGISPERYVDYAALRGDTSDNLPGVPGVGEKTAAKLMIAYGSLEGIYEHLDEQTPRLADNLAEAKEQVFLNRELMTLVRDVPVSLESGGRVATPEDLRSDPWDPAEAGKVFDGLAFRTLWDRLLETEGIELEAAVGDSFDVAVTTELDKARLGALFKKALALEPVWEGGELSGVVVMEDSAEAATFVPFDRLNAVAGKLADPAIPKTAHDAKAMIRALFEAEMDFDGLAFDTAIASYLINPAQRAPDLADLALRELGLAVSPSGDDSAASAAAQGAFEFDSTGGPDLEGAGRRAMALGRLVKPLTGQLEARGGLELLHTIELPLVRVLAKMERTGIGVDRDYLVTLGEDLRKRLGELESSIHEAAGEPFNVNSTLQLREVLFDKLELPVLKKTPKGVPSTDASVLQKLAAEHPIVDHLLHFRELEKLRSTYVDALIPLIQPDGRVRGRFNQMGAATGRLSAEQPNLQNIPVRSAEGRAIRYAFVAPPGRTFVVADYSQVELRILAHLSEDAGLIEAFKADLDIHQATAARVFEVSPQDVTSEQRRRAKVINFGLLYGMEAYGLAQRLEIGREEAEAHIEAYFSQFPGVQAFMSGIVDKALSTGYTTTLLGRRRYLPELASSNFRTRQMGERMALNAPIQGTAADIVKKAMIELDQNLDTAGFDADMILQVHDELVVECLDADVEAVIEMLRSTMEGILELVVPLKVDIATGSSLGECKEEVGHSDSG